ncbi:MAG: hypothetical protein NTW14_09280 [bacterium]|nr:hypothetical protein [bacterium]
MKFFFDHNISPRLVDFLAEIAKHDLHSEDEYTYLKKKFKDTSIPDDVWIPQLGKEGGWIIITHDRGILTNPVNKSALRKANLTIFFLTKGFISFTFLDQTWRLIKYWAKIEEKAKVSRPGTVFKVSPNGNITG